MGNTSLFYQWLLKQKKKDDPIGDLACDVIRDKTFPSESNDIERIKSHLIFKRACSEALCALDEAWEEFKSGNKKRSGITLKKRFSILKRDDFRCQLCGSNAQSGCKLEIDHKIPIAKGGGNDDTNLWTLCFDCNRGKGTSSI